MGFGSWWHWAIVILLVVLLFGRGKVSDLMGDVAKGIKNFKKGMADDPADVAAAEQARLEQQAAEAKAEAERVKG